MTQPSDILFSAIGTMTGGLITDLTTAMMGMVVVAFIVFGLDHLRDVFEESAFKRNIDYQDYANRRARREYFQSRYASESTSRPVSSTNSKSDYIDAEYDIDPSTKSLPQRHRVYQCD